MSAILSIVLGLGLAATTGLRVFVPLLTISILSYYNIGNIPLSDSFTWIASPLAIMTFAIAAFVEILAYYIPFVDNALDTIAVPMASLCGTLISMSVMGADINPMVQWTIAIIAGGGLAGFVKGKNAGLRLASSAGTAGTLNPVLSTTETLTAILFSVIGWIVPAFFLIVLVFLFFLIGRFFYNRKKSTPSP